MQDELSDLARVAPLFGIFLDELDEAFARHLGFVAKPRGT